MDLHNPLGSLLLTHEDYIRHALLAGPVLLGPGTIRRQVDLGPQACRLERCADLLGVVGALLAYVNDTHLLGSEPHGKRARKVLDEADLGEYFVHITGHGIGLRYHEFIPFLMPGATGTLEAGMVSTVEPGVYIPDFGGIRIEDSVAVGTDGPIFLSTPRKPW